MATSQLQTRLRTNRSHRICTIIKIERQDGTTLRYTDHDVPIVDDAGDTYTVVEGFQSTARQKQSALKEQNTEFLGAITSSEITDADLFAGLYREAKITERVVDWRYPWAGHYHKSVYWIDEIEFDGEVWRASVSGVTRLLRREIGELMTRTCRYTLGDSRCGVDLSSTSPFYYSSTVATVTSTMRKLQFVASNSGDSDGFFDGGFVYWTSGDNQGTFSEVKTWENSFFRVTLQLPTPYDISVSDTFQMYAGCDKTIKTCRLKFDNRVRFGGFPSLPGTDRVYQQGADF